MRKGPKLSLRTASASVLEQAHYRIDELMETNKRLIAERDAAESKVGAAQRVASAELQRRSGPGGEAMTDELFRRHINKLEADIQKAHQLRMADAITIGKLYTKIEDLTIKLRAYEGQKLIENTVVDKPPEDPPSPV